ncbi:unnamed protein product [Toxocara canis]|uniref:Uncharacterized protein n=1 Tax=Toxocara canis TaxID=6265 RepID=A0A183VD01_TOXCA|nr:unnamed protein product [Toxocara canis]
MRTAGCVVEMRVAGCVVRVRVAGCAIEMRVAVCFVEPWVTYDKESANDFELNGQEREEMDEEEEILCDARFAVREASLPMDAVSTVPFIPTSKREDIVFPILPYEIFRAVMCECTTTDAWPCAMEPHWVSVNRKYVRRPGSTSWPRRLFGCSGKERHWCILRVYMEMDIRLYPHDSQILRSATTVFMLYEWPLPCWLPELHQERDVGDFANILLYNDHVEVAFEISMKSAQSANEAVISERSQSILPYTQIDMFFHLVEKSGILL